MRRAMFVAFLLVVLFLAVFASAPAAQAWGPCNGPYGGYAGCSGAGYNGGMGYYGSSYHGGGFVYNRVCYWSWYWGSSHLVCSYRLVPAYPVSGYYGYGY